MKVFGVSVEMSSDPKKYFGFTFDQLTELVFTVKIDQLSTQPFVRLPVTVSNRLNAPQSKTKQFYGIHAYVSSVNSSNVKPEYFLGSLDISDTIKKFERIFQ